MRHRITTVSLIVMVIATAFQILVSEASINPSKKTRDLTVNESAGIGTAYYKVTDSVFKNNVIFKGKAEVHVSSAEWGADSNAWSQVEGAEGQKQNTVGQVLQASSATVQPANPNASEDAKKKVVYLPFLSRGTTSHPANPNAGEDAKKVLSYIAGLPDRPDKRVISGQFTDHGQYAEYGYNERVVGLQQATGKWVAMAGFDYCDVFASQSGAWSDPALTNQVAGNYWKSGGLVTIFHHFINPWTGESPWKFETVGNLADLVDPATEVHDTWMTEVDRLAAGLAQLRDAGVVILFSPFNEMNGGWFWWGPGEYNYGSWASQEDFINLWRHLFNYLTYTKDLDNLLWIYCPVVQRFASWKTADYYYPGDGYVDIVALSYYSDSLDYINAYGSYDKLIALGKPFGFGGLGPDSKDGTYDYSAFIDKVRSDYPKTSFFQAWHRHWAIVENQGAAALMGDPWMITRDELDWGSEPIPTPSPTPTATSTPTPTAINTPLPTYTPTPTSTSIPSPTNTPTSTNTPLPADTPTLTPTSTPTPTATNTPTSTNTPLPADTPTLTPTSTPTPTPTQTLLPTYTPTATNTPTFAPTNTPTSTNTPLPADTPTLTPTSTPTPTPTQTLLPTCPPTATDTPLPTYRPTPPPN